jgi:hypothetical protein
MIFFATTGEFVVRMEAGSRATLFCVLPNIGVFRSSGSPCTNNGSVVGNFWTMDTFQGRSTTACKNLLQAIQPSAATCLYASFVDAQVAEQFDGESVAGM